MKGFGWIFKQSLAERHCITEIVDNVIVGEGWDLNVAFQVFGKHSVHLNFGGEGDSRCPDCHPILIQRQDINVEHLVSEVNGTILDRGLGKYLTNSASCSYVDLHYVFCE